MKKKYALALIFFILSIFIIVSCTETDEGDDYVPVAPVSPVVELTQVPYPKLSDYKFFLGELKNQQPAHGVLPFEPASSLFTDYALKKRFVWMPAGTKATYVADNKTLDLPVGAVLIKTFYYNNVQNVTPAGSTRIIETRLMIKKAEGWIFANYVWNDEQTDAELDLEGSETAVEWIDEHNLPKTVQYHIPAEYQCRVCHKSSQLINNQVVLTQLPIGIKPQNLNWNYDYGSGPQNQLTKWIAEGYLDSSFSLPSAENTAVNYKDTSKPIDQRARAYVDINCAHCHSAERHCSYRPMRFAYSDTHNNNTNMGACVSTQDMQDFPQFLNKIVTPGDIGKSMLYYRIDTDNPGYMMPLHGRTLIHTEGVQLMRDWINSLRDCN